MKARELNQGNLLTKDGQIWVVNNIYGASGQIDVLPLEGTNGLNRYSVHQFDPIAITEELLIAFGFEKDTKEEVMNFEGFKLWWTDDDIRYYYHLNSELLINFDYIHEVQNFWDAMLTGEELTLKHAIH